MDIVFSEAEGIKLRNFLKRKFDLKDCSFCKKLYHNKLYCETTCNDGSSICCLFCNKDCDRKKPFPANEDIYILAMMSKLEGV